MSQQTALLGKELYRAIPDGKVDSVWKGWDIPQGYSGKDVIIGFTDWGFDYSHPVFYDTLMNRYRVLRAWDQYRNSGPAPEGFDYGTEWAGKEELLSAQCDTFNVYGYNYHGNHVASIAAGGGAGTLYRGVAYEADMLFVSILVDEQAIIDAFCWMHQVAQEERKRLVINMSWGLYYIGNMDGTGRLASVVDSLSSLGVVFVSSAGNNGDVDFHLSHSFSGAGDTLRSQFLFSGGSNVQWGQSISMLNSPDSPFSFQIQLLDASNRSVGYSPFYHTGEEERYVDTFLVTGSYDTIYYNAFIEKSNSYNQRPQVRLRVKKFSSAYYKFGLAVTASAGEFHAWNVIELTNGVGNWGGAFTAPQGIQGWKRGDPQYGIGAPGNAESVITVAAHQSVFQAPSGILRGGEIADFSSYGPLIDGSSKPDISAPGVNIIAALSSFTDQYRGNITATVAFQGRNYSFVPLSGTSMSSPFVAGVVALLLQANPYLSSSQIKRILQETAYQDSHTALSGPDRFGYGKIHAYEAIRQALSVTGNVEMKPKDSRYTVYPNPATHTVFISLQSVSPEIKAELYDFCGKKIEQQFLYPGVNTLNIQTLPSGCYFIRITEGSHYYIHKLIKN